MHACCAEPVCLLCCVVFLPGQAVLTLPLKSVDVSVALPPGLQLAATPAGHLDCRLQLLGAHMDWPATGVVVWPFTQCAHNRLPCHSKADISLSWACMWYT